MTTEAYRKWYKANREDFNHKRRKRYRLDKEYRERQRELSRRSMRKIRSQEDRHAKEKGKQETQGSQD